MTGTMDASASAALTGAPLLLRLEIEDFLYRESALLDTHRHEEWLALLHDDFVYRVPLPVARDEISMGGYDDMLELANESKSFLRMRFARVTSDFAWAERPAPYLRHFISNVRVTAEDPGSVWIVESNVLVVRSRQPEDPVHCPAGRRDRLQRHGDSFLLLDRTVWLDTEVPNDGQLGVIY